MVLSLQMERKSGFPFTMSATEKDPKTGLPREVTKLTRRVSSMTLEEPMRKCHRLNPYPRHGLKWKHDSSGWADTEEYWNSYDSRQAVSGNVNCSEEQDEHHNCSWFNRSSIGGFHKSKTCFWTDKDILLNWYNGGLSPPWPRIVVPIVGPKQWKQWHTWKIPAALEHFANVYGTMGVFHPSNFTFLYTTTTTITTLLQSCPTLCDPIDGSPQDSAVSGILQARTLEWVAISFSNAWKWKVKGKSLSRVRPSVTPWTSAFQAPPIHGIFQARVLEW